MSKIITKAALALKQDEDNVQVVKFESYKRKKVNKTEQVQQEQYRGRQTYNKRDLDLKTIKHEVVKFGMSGFDPTKKEEARIALAVSLGAIPPKKEYMNYKELMQKRKEEKQKTLEEKQLMMSKSVLQTANKPKHKKISVGNDVGHLLSSYGKVQKKNLKKDDTSNKKKRRK